MDLNAKKVELLKMILEIEDASLIDKILSFLKNEIALAEKKKNA